MFGTLENPFTIGGGWGDRIQWNDESIFSNLTDKTKFHLTGWKEQIPKEGDILRGDFVKSTIWFKFKSVDRQRDPSDMFFAEVVPFRQDMK